MKTFFSVAVLLSCLYTNAQSPTRSYAGKPRFEFGSSFGNVMMQKIDEDIDRQAAMIGGFNAGYNLHLSQRRNYIHFGVGFAHYRYITDGHFVGLNGSQVFETTPADYKSNEIQLDYVEFPVQYTFLAFDGVGVSFGPYVGYMLNSKQLYKIGDDRFTKSIPLEEKLQGGLLFDTKVTIFPKGRFLVNPYVGFGAGYQFTQHLKERPSFQPLRTYISFGLAWW